MALTHTFEPDRVTNSYTWFSQSVSARGWLTQGRTRELGPGDGSKWPESCKRQREAGAEWEHRTKPYGRSGSSPQSSRARSFWWQMVEWRQYKRKTSRITKEYEKLQTEQRSPQRNCPDAKEPFSFGAVEIAGTPSSSKRGIEPIDVS